MPTFSRGQDPQLDIEGAFGSLAAGPQSGLIVLPDLVTAVHRKLIITLAARHRLPSIAGISYHANDGGLISYGYDAVDIYRQAASYVDRILRGASPGELPVQAPTKLELVINMKTANALGLAIPQSVLIRAERLIE